MTSSPCSTGAASTGPKYEVVTSQEEFDGSCPPTRTRTTPPAPARWAAKRADIDARLTMHDVILAKKGSKVKTRHQADAPITRPGSSRRSAACSTIPVERGWLSVEAKVKGKGKKKGKKAKSEQVPVHQHPPRGVRRPDDPRGAGEGADRRPGEHQQAGDPGRRSEFRAYRDPHNVGDLPVQDPATRSPSRRSRRGVQGQRGAAELLLRSDLFDETSVRPHGRPRADKPGLKTEKAFVTGNDAAELTPSGLWPSDHGGVVSRLQLKK